MVQLVLSSRNVLHEWLDILEEDNRTTNRNIVPTDKTITATNKQKNYL